MSKGVWQRLWDFLKTDISVSETTQGAVDTAKTFLDLSRALNDNKSLPELTPLIGQVSSLLDVLNLSIVQVVGAGLPFVSIASKLLQFYLDSTKEDPSLEDCVELVGQAAYLESFKKFFSDDANKHLLEKLNKEKASERLQKQISQFSKSFTLTESEARTVLLCFHESKLAEGLNPIVLARLVEAGIEEGQAKIIVERISRMTHRDIKPALAEIKDKVKKLSVIYGSEWQRELETYDSIDRYLEEVIAEKPKEKVFEENFGFEDIYVELQVEAIAKNNNNSQPQFIEEWALGLLNDESKSGQVLFIQGEPGRGKSVFCRMFADRVRRELYPIWIPILIRLRDITNFADDFGTLLRDAVNTNFTRNDNGWLTDRNTRFLFILDGFDELLLQLGNDHILKNFLARVSAFQDNCKNIRDLGHRVIITGRPLALFGIEREMRSNLERVKIIDVSLEIQGRWLQKWAVLKGKNTAQKFQAFIRDDKCPRQVKTLAKEPLLLYLLAAMHGDNRFQIEDFQKTGTSAKILIYDEMMDWVLNKQRSYRDGNDNLNKILTGLEICDIRYILKESALCVTQAGGGCVSLEKIESRLEIKAPELVEYLKNTSKYQGRNTLHIALATFYLKASDGKNNSMEFLHKSFGEFLFAERLVDSLLTWSRLKIDIPRSKQVLEVDNKELEWQTYDLFGFGKLTPEILEYLTALIEREFNDKENDFIRLFNRLNQFYLDWSDGKFIEAIDLAVGVSPLALRKALNQDVLIGQRKVDVYTGLNILILLLTLHRYAQVESKLKNEIAFHPCGIRDKKESDANRFDPIRLQRIISYSQGIGIKSFVDIVGHFLSDVDLSGVDLSGSNLSGANLSGANLNRSNLSRADLRLVKLRGADLSSARLCGADLSGADLSGENSNLSGADLSGANLRNVKLCKAVLMNTDLSGTDLRGTDLRGAKLSGAKLNSLNFQNVDLRSADLSYTYLREADLGGANLRNSNLISADLRIAKLCGADLCGTKLHRADLRGAELYDTALSGADLSHILSDENTIWSSARDLHKAINVPDALVGNSQFRAAVLLCNGSDLVVSGDVDGAIAAYLEAQTLDHNLKISTFYWNQLGWFGGLHNRATDVLFACEKAIDLEKSARHHNTRGLARALTGNLTGATEDFEAAINSGELKGEMLEKRQRWLEALKSGINPFTPKELEALRASDGATS